MTQNKKKLIRLTTADISLKGLLKGQLKYLSQYYDLIGVASDTGVLQATGERENIRVVNIPMEREISIKKDFKSLAALYRFFRKEKPYIVHANTPKGSLLAMVAAMFARVPKRIYTVTGLRYQGATGLFRFILATMERITCFCATHVIPEGKGVMKALKDDKITCKSMAVLHNGNINGKDTLFFSKEQLIKDRLNLPNNESIDERLFTLERNKIRSEIKVDANDYVFIFVGRVVKDKGIVELVHTIKKLSAEYKQIKLLIIGTMEQGDAIPDDIKEFILNSQHIIYLGRKDDIRPYLFASDALVFPSYREGFPNVPMEAGLMKLPSIVTNINGCNEIITENYNGNIISAHNINNPNRQMHEELYRTMKDYILQPEKTKAMGKAARQNIIEKYNQNDVWKAHLDFYEKLK